MAEQCKARAKTTGQRCGRPVVPGASVCRFHGGAAPQVKAAAQLRILAAADRVAARLVGVALSPKSKGSDVVAAAKDLLDRAGLAPVRKSEVRIKSPREMTIEELEAWAGELEASDADSIGGSGEDSPAV